MIGDMIGEPRREVGQGASRYHTNREGEKPNWRENRGGFSSWKVFELKSGLSCESRGEILLVRLTSRDGHQAARFTQRGQRIDTRVALDRRGGKIRCWWSMYSE